MSRERQKNLLLFAIPFIVIFAFYLRTVCHSVFTGDSGELAFTIYTMGIAHPPGYPLLTLLGKFFLLFTPGNVAFALNLMTALFAAAAVGMGAFVIRHILFSSDQRNSVGALAISIAAAILWGFSDALWAGAVGLEVYSLGILLITLSLLYLLKYDESGKQSFIVMSAYFLFLGLTNHLSATVMFIPVLMILLSKKASPKTWIAIAGLFILALTAYLYLPIRSSRFPICDWDHPASLGSLIDHITARRYRSFISGMRFDNYFENIWRSIRILVRQFPAGLGLLGILGIFIYPHISRRIRLYLIIMILFNLMTVALYDIPDIEQYYLPTFFISTIGLAMIFVWLLEKFKTSRCAYIASGLLGLIAIGTIAANFGRNDQSGNRLTTVYGMDIFNSVPQGSILISVADNANSSIYYLHFVENVRPDLEVYDATKTYWRLRDRLNLTGSDRNRTGQELCHMILAAYPQKSYLVKEHVLRKGSPFIYENMKLNPQGLVYRMGNLPADMSVWNNIEIPSIDTLENSIEFKGITMLCNLHLCRGEDYEQMGDTTSAVREYREARKIGDLSPEASVHNSLGVFFRHHNWQMFADEEYNRALKSEHLTAFEKANVIINIANLEKDRGKLTESIDLYKQALKIHPDNNDGKYNLALAEAYLSLSQGQSGDAAKSFERALSLSGPDPRLVYNLGILYDRGLNDTARAVFNYQRFIELTPDRPECEAVRKRIADLSRKTIK